MLAVWVNETLGLTGSDQYSSGETFYKINWILFCFLSGTICNWLHYCNFKVVESKKGIYYDGHEREDVVKVIYIRPAKSGQHQIWGFKFLNMFWDDIFLARGYFLSSFGKKRKVLRIA